MDFSVINEIILAIILGIVQGISEFLPISSTAHLRLVAALLIQGKDIGLTASNIIQFGTLLSILVYFKKDLQEYYNRIKQILTLETARNEFVTNFKTWWSFPESKNLSIAKKIDYHEPTISNQTDLVLSQIFIGTLPILILGFVLKALAENNRSLREIALFLIVGSLLMYIAEQIYTRAKDKQKPAIMMPSEVILVGLFQSLAAFPGISRSGATISGALMLGRNRAESVKFSFLLSIPALAILGILDLLKLILNIGRNGLVFIPQNSQWAGLEINLSLISLIIAFGVAYFVGIAVLKWLLKYLSSNTFKNFIIYRVLLAVVIVVLLVFKVV